VSRFARHFFVCTNERPIGGKPSCGARGRALCRALMAGLAEHAQPWTEVAVSESGCLGPCFDGPMMVVYPEGTWYAAVQPTDVPELVAHLAGGRVVDRLVYRWPAP
jgi:(2Fe-2S) ferredoxin